MCSFVTNLSSSCLRFKAQSSQHRTHIGDRVTVTKIYGLYNILLLIASQSPQISCITDPYLLYACVSERGDKIHFHLFREFILERVLDSSLMFIQLK